MRRYPRAIFATGWQWALDKLRFKRTFYRQTGRKRAETGQAPPSTKPAGDTRRSVVIPAAIVTLLGTGLTTRNAIYQWIDWNYRTENPHAILIPDGGDVIVTVDLSRLHDRDARDVINASRHRATSEGNGDVATMLSDWTGREIADAEIERWAGRRLTIFTG